MKLEKREITLNEKDSLLDMLFFETALLSAYQKAAQSADRVEEAGELARLSKEVEKEVRLLEKRAIAAPYPLGRKS